MDKPRLIARGSTGDVELYEHKIVLKRGSGCLNPFAKSGNKQIMIADITAIDYRAPKKRQPGHIQFIFLGGQESKELGVFVRNDLNTVMFSRKQESSFSALKQALEQRMLIHRAGVQTSIAPGLAADELTKFANLRDKGVINNKEFEKQKRRILGR